jgi:hypothetical protein
MQLSLVVLMAFYVSFGLRLCSLAHCLRQTGRS